VGRRPTGLELPGVRLAPWAECWGGAARWTARVCWLAVSCSHLCVNSSVSLPFAIFLPQKTFSLPRALFTAIDFFGDRFVAIRNNTGHTCAVVVWFSEDGGVSYQRGATLQGACETSLAEMSDGRLLMLGNDCSKTGEKAP
jgi:hypothetical protein